MRIFRSIGFAFAAALAIASSGWTYAFEAPARLVAYAAEKCSELYGADSARLEATLSQWRSGVGAGFQATMSSLRKSGNHFEMKSVVKREEYEGFSPA